MSASDSRVARLTELATRQHGLVSWNQLLHLGLDKDAVGRLRTRGWLHHIARNVYVVGHEDLSREATILAGVMTYGAAAVASDLTAVDLHGLLPPWDEVPVAPVHVTVPSAARPVPRDGTVLHRRHLRADETTRLGTVPVVTVERALLDFGARAPRRRLERAVDQGIVERRTTVARLHGCVAAASDVTGVAALRAVLDAAARYGTLTRSALEERLLLVTRGAGLPDPRFDVRVTGIAGRLDAFLDGCRVGVEVDGWQWHRTAQRQHDDRTKELQARSVGVALNRYSARQLFEAELLVAADLAATIALRRIA